MKTSLYAVLMCKDIQKEADFFMNLFDFKKVFDSGWYISLKDDDDFELAMIDNSHDTIPKQFRKQCEGVILNIEVDDVDLLYLKIINRNDISILLEPKDEDYGQRHFMMETPSKILIDIIQNIQPTNEYLDNYK